jgi:2-polyprenyl-6-methoxyphenol hydroxylase-like FAD-dependent oxidoreductase
VASDRAAVSRCSSVVREGLPVVIAGTGFAAACAALRLLAVGFRPVLLQSRRGRDLEGVEILPASMADQLALLGLGDVLARAGASPAEGIDVSWGRRDDGPHRYRTLHIDRLALRHEALVEATARGAEIRSIAHLPALSATRGKWVDCGSERFFAALDATGRRAVWARPVERLGRTCADTFAVATSAFSLFARVIRLPSGWAYAAGSGGKATLGVVRDKPPREASLPEEIWQALRLPRSLPVRRLGRRPAFPQYATAPLRGRVLAIGDAALAHNPLAGRGLSFALGSALAAAATIASWRNRPDACADAAEYYREYVAAECRRHLAFLASFDDDPPPIRPIGSGCGLSWQAQIAMTPLAIGECIRREPAIRLNDGGFVRWLGEFDLLRLQALCAVRARPDAVIARLCALGLGGREAALLLQWAVQKGVLAETEAERGGRPAAPIRR